MTITAAHLLRFMPAMALALSTLPAMAADPPPTVRIDSGDLSVVAAEVRELLDSLGAVKTRIFRAMETLKGLFSEGGATWNAMTS